MVDLKSLLATRLRSYDMLQIADTYARRAAEFFSLEMWGGATFDTSMRFLKESPWQRLTQLRERIPNILFQMLLRASNAVGYTNYPDNVVKVFVREAADAGIDVFRVFDALNWAENMQVAMEAVVESGAICEAAICYTGDILNPARPKYDLKYYVTLAKQLEKMGAHILAIKDMAGLCKPEAARECFICAVAGMRPSNNLPFSHALQQVAARRSLKIRCTHFGRTIPSMQPGKPYGSNRFCQCFWIPRSSFGFSTGFRDGFCCRASALAAPSILAANGERVLRIGVNMTKW